MSKIELKDLKVGMKVKLKTQKQLLDEGWQELDKDLLQIEGLGIVGGTMIKLLGQEVVISDFWANTFGVEEDAHDWCWYVELIDHVVNTQTTQIKVGDKVRLKTKKQLEAAGWEYDEAVYYLDCATDVIIEEMFQYLGKVYVVSEILSEFDGTQTFILDGTNNYYWDTYMVDCVVESPDSQKEPYYAVTNNTEPVNLFEESTVWDVESIKRTFEDLEIYDKGYKDGFKRAMDLMKQKFGVEL